MSPASEENKATALQLVNGVGKLVAANKENTAEIIGEVVDYLTGSDETALVSRVPGLTPSMSEMIFDAIKDMAVEKIQGAMTD